jgi:outer membrane biosynthesis protein TonB
MGRRLGLTAAFVITILLALPAARAEALTIRDVVELTKAGLSDDVLLALIDVDRTVFTIDTPTLKMLKDAGVSEPVIIAMIRSGRSTPPEPQALPEPQAIEAAPAPVPEPQPVQPPEPAVREVPVPVPVPVAVPVAVPVVVAPERRPRHECVHYEYWGFEGKLRPDAYAPPNACR